MDLIHEREQFAGRFRPLEGQLVSVEALHGHHLAFSHVLGAELHADRDALVDEKEFLIFREIQLLQ